MESLDNLQMFRQSSQYMITNSSQIQVTFKTDFWSTMQYFKDQFQYAVLKGVKYEIHQPDKREASEMASVTNGNNIDIE